MKRRTRLETLRLAKDPVMKAIIEALWRDDSSQHVESERLTNLSNRSVNVSFKKSFYAIPAGWIRVYRMKLVSVGKWKQYDVLYYHTTENWKTMDGFSLQIDASEALAGIIIEYEFK